MENQMSKSEFIGGAFANFFINLATLVLGILSLGLAYPALVCWKLRWMASKTYINGRRLVFDGKAMQLFGSYLLWLLLSVASFGIYAIFVMPLNMQRWENKHTHFEGESGRSVFDGSIWGLFGVRILTTFVNIITLSFGSYWSHCYRERWYRKHQIIDEYRMSFDGTGWQYFGKKIIWRILTIITFGIYSFWSFVKTEAWTISHVHISNKEKTEEVEFKDNSILFASIVGLIISGLGCLIAFYISSKTANNFWDALISLLTGSNSVTGASIGNAIYFIAGLAISMIVLVKTLKKPSKKEETQEEMETVAEKEKLFWGKIEKKEKLSLEEEALLKIFGIGAIIFFEIMVYKLLIIANAYPSVTALL